MNIQTLTDARTCVENSGVLDWDWDSAQYSNDQIIDDLLPQFVYENCNSSDEINEILPRFISNVLKQNPRDYGVN